MEKWLRENLSSCLDCVVTDEMMTTILAINDDDSFDNYFGNLLSEEHEEHRLFLLNCRRMLLSGKQPRNVNTSNNSTARNRQPLIPLSGNKKKNKYSNLYTTGGKISGDSFILKGRRSCECQAMEHTLINNCLKCGRIVCEQEGSGPCLFCGEPVYTNEEHERMLKCDKRPKSKSPKTQSKKQQVQPQNDAGLKAALEQRDRLLEYDRNSEKRTTVIDDELDYFQENSVWLTDAEREKFAHLKQEMYDMKHGSRIKRKIKVDFAGRELPEELISKEYEENVIRQVTEVTSASGNSWSHGSQRGHSEIVLPPNVSQILYKPTGKGSTQAATSDGLERVYNRVQDKELMEMQDMRKCLSMHQPWASLLVAGIKKHEGRIWYTEHRGRLWIASTVKEAKPEDIEELQQFYRNIYNDSELKFPENYPTGSLLGCVIIEDCLPQEEYRELYPNGESDSPYVLICKNPEQLPVRLPVQGEHKIYDLPMKTHFTACKTLLRHRSIKG